MGAMMMIIMILPCSWLMAATVCKRNCFTFDSGNHTNFYQINLIRRSHLNSPHHSHSLKRYLTPYQIINPQITQKNPNVISSGNQQINSQRNQQRQWQAFDDCEWDQSNWDGDRINFNINYIQFQVQPRNIRLWSDPWILSADTSVRTLQWQSNITFRSHLITNISSIITITNAGNVMTIMTTTATKHY